MRKAFLVIATNFLISLFCSFYVINVQAQEKDLQSFEENLEQVFNQEIVYELMDRAEELDRVYFSDINAVRFELEPDRNWRFLFKKVDGWSEVVGQKPEDLTAYYISDLVVPMKGEEISQVFAITGRPEEVNPVDIDHFSSKRFAETFLLRNKHRNYLVIIAVHAYPNGNMTSWFRETRYYFEGE